MYRDMSTKVIDLTPYLVQARRTGRREALRDRIPLWTQYLSLGALALYGLLRAALCPGAPLGAYSGPLALLWPASFFLLLASCVSDQLLWRREAGQYSQHT